LALPLRWVTERADPWLGRSHRLANDWHAFVSSAEAWLLIAHIRALIRRLARFHAALAGRSVELLDQWDAHEFYLMRVCFDRCDANKPSQG
jgi:hypothetical protein